MRRDEVCEYLQELSDSQGQLVFCEKMDGKSERWNYRRHSHEYLEIIFFLSGNIFIDTSDEHLHLKTYGILFYPPGVPHQELKNPQLNQEVIALGILIHTLHCPGEAFLTSDKNGVFRFLVNQIYDQYCGQTLRSEKLCELYLQALFCTAAQRFSEETQNPFDVAQIVAEYIRNNYEEALSIEQLAKLVSISPSYLIRIFRKELKTTPMRYLNTIRIQEAKNLLQTSSLSINQISERIGYEDSSYFWRVFKHATGSSPSDYRKSFQ